MTNVARFKTLLYFWSRQFLEVAWLDSNGHKDPHGVFDAMLAVDALTVLQTDIQNAFEDLQLFQEGARDWIFGYLSYDLKNDLEVLNSRNPDRLGFPELYFFRPKKLILIKGKQVEFNYLNMVADEIEDDFREISEAAFPKSKKRHKAAAHIKLGIFKDEYFSRVQKMLAHIRRGDIYEANFCQECYAERIEIDAWRTYDRLNAISKAPFSCFLRLNDRYLLSASPERYLQRKEEVLISQPIKGTARRSQDPKEDAAFKKALAEDSKERAENIMIVDLVRNDMSKSAQKGSVVVEELCKVYTFEQVHQMVSTIRSKVREGVGSVALLRDTFPMGSMTGAPKLSAMKIIEELEAFKRGLYSGAVGYFTPSGDFDFNVVIRSILYNETEKYVSFSVGSAITAKARPEKEYEECLLKAKAMREVLEGK